MKKVRIRTVIALVCALAAATLSFELLSKHLTGSSGSSWFEAGCGESEGGATTNCAKVLASPYSYWPPQAANEPPGTSHFPVAFLGLVYYSSLAVWLIGVGCPSRSRRWLHLIPTLLVFTGLAGSAYFTYIMFTKLNEWCPWCLVTHILNLVAAVCILSMWLGWRRRKTTSDATPGKAGAKPTGPMLSAGHPTWRLAGVTLLAIVFVVLGEEQMLGEALQGRMVLSTRRGLDQCVAVVRRLQRNPDALLSIWKSTPRYEIAVRPDDPVRLGHAHATKPLEAVIFSDFECPSCKRLAALLDSKIEPLFGGYLKITHKNYPLNSECNPMTNTKIHPYACLAAEIAEAARAIGGSSAFWKAHDDLFAHQDEMTKGLLSPDAVAGRIGLDPEQMNRAMAQQEVTQRIREDAGEGRAYGVNGTPTLFLDGRRVDGIMRSDLLFWDRVADEYWKSRNEPRPESTRLAHTAVTPGTPNRKGAP